MPDLDQATAAVAADNLLREARRIWGDSDIPSAVKLDALAQVANDLVEPLAAVRQVLPALLSESGPEGVRARVAAAEAKRVADLQAKHDALISGVIERDAATAAVAKARTDLAEASEVAALYDAPGAPRREKVLAKGALEGATRALRDAEKRLADLTAAPKGATP